MIYLLGYTHAIRSHGVAWCPEPEEHRDSRADANIQCPSHTHREPDSTYFDLPQPSQGNSEATGSEESNMDVFHLQGMTSSVMVSGAVLKNGHR